MPVFLLFQPSSWWQVPLELFLTEHLPPTSLLKKEMRNNLEHPQHLSAILIYFQGIMNKKLPTVLDHHTDEIKILGSQD